MAILRRRPCPKLWSCTMLASREIDSWGKGGIAARIAGQRSPTGAQCPYRELLLYAHPSGARQALRIVGETRR